MMRVLLDTNVILDVFLRREPFIRAAAAVWQANEDKLFEGYVSAITPVNLFYIAGKIQGSNVARAAVVELLSAWRICPIDASILQSALTLPMRDYEDAVQHASASAIQIDAIVTRNLKDYTGATLPVFSPEDFLKQLPSRKDE
jgi:predicted nucleic acid-binding protein